MSSLVSAIIPTKNRADLLRRALDSVLNQTYSNLEIVVVNDGSTDQTPELLQTYKKKPNVILNIIENERSVGAAQARNQAIEISNGEFIAGLDDDDIWHEDRIRELMRNYSDEYSCVTSNNMMVFSNYRSEWKKKKKIDLDTLLYTNQVGNQVLVRRDRVLDIGGFDAGLPAAQDYDLWVRLCAEYGPIKNISKPLQTIYMNHQSERITDRSSFEGYFCFYKKHKHRMNRKQRKYQLYKIRRVQQKKLTLYEITMSIPAFRLWKEFKQILINKYFD